MEATLSAEALAIIGAAIAAATWIVLDLAKRFGLPASYVPYAIPLLAVGVFVAAWIVTGDESLAVALAGWTGLSSAAHGIVKTATRDPASPIPRK